MATKADSNIVVTEAVGRYAATLKGDAKQSQQQELNRFVRWFEGRPMGALTAQDVERYQEEFEKTGADTRRLESVKLFLAFAHKQGMTEINFGKFIRIKRMAGRSAKTASRSTSEQVEMPHGEMLTAEGFQRLQDELDTLINVKRPEIAQELFEARIDKDFRENAPYDAAKHHQAEVEARIRQLQAILARAQIIEGQITTGGRIGLGTKVVLHDMQHEENLEYTLVSQNEANPREGRISIASPVGRALVDRKPGDVVDVEAPGGVMKYRIDRVET